MQFFAVRLYKFPTLKKGAKFRKYVGHAAHVTNVRWSSDRTRLISTGGEDHSVFQWRLVPEGSPAPTGDSGFDGTALRHTVLTYEHYARKYRTIEYNQISISIIVQYTSTALYSNNCIVFSLSMLCYSCVAYTDTNTEGSDSELSDVAPLDSDVERERQKNYDRPVYKEEVAQIRRDASKLYAAKKPFSPKVQAGRPSTAPSKRGASSAHSARSTASAASSASTASSTASQKKKEAPQESLALEWVFGYAAHIFAFPYQNYSIENVLIITKMS